MRIALLMVLLAAVSVPSYADDAVDFLKAVGAGDLVNVQRMLARDPSLVNAHRPNGNGAVTIALFLNKGEGFFDPQKNEVLQAILAQKPQLNLFETAALGTPAQLDALLTDPATITRRTSFGWTLLHMAAFAGNSGTTELLIRKGASIDARADSKFRNTPLQASLLSSQYGTARLLLEHGADALVRQSKGFTPMHEAAQSGRIDIIQLLLDHGAEINSVADNGQTPLAEAIRGKHEDVAAWMKSKGAVVGVQVDEEVAKK